MFIELFPISYIIKVRNNEVNVMKKFLLLILFVCIFTLFSCDKNSDLENEGYFKFILNNDETYTIYGNNEMVEHLVIPETYNGKPVTRIGTMAFREYKSLKTVTMSDNITDINQYSFFGCENLETIFISNNITHLGGMAFSGCVKLIYTEWNNGKYLGNEDNPYLILIEKIDNNVTSFTINERTRIVGPGAINGDLYLTSLDIPDSIVSFEDNRIVSELFTSFPSSIKNIGCLTPAFCQLKGKNKYMGGLYLGNEDNPYLILTGFENDVTSYEIHQNTKFIGDYAFLRAKITSITIPEGVLGIGQSAFEKCYYLESVTLPQSLVSINECAFYDCTSLADITIPNNVKRIGPGAFGNNSALYSITLPKGLGEIKYCLFSGCKSLVNISLPDSIIFIGISAFDGCSNLTNIIIPNNVMFVEQNAFKGCTNIKTIYNNANIQLDIKYLGISDTTKVYEKDEWSYVDGVPTPNKN
jgi:hypothetical protein